MGTSWNAFVPSFVRLSVQHQLLSGDDNKLVELTNKNLMMRRAGLSGGNICNSVCFFIQNHGHVFQPFDPTFKPEVHNKWLVR